MRVIKFLLLTTIIVVFSGCASRTDVAYFQNLTDTSEFAPTDYKTVIKPGDLLSIIVSSKDMVTVSPYNRLVPGVSTGSVSQVQGQQQLQSYLVDNTGTIEFPTMGKIVVSGLSRTELERKIRAQIQPFVPEVQVTVRFLNFKITVIGEVARPGTFSVTDERVTLLQALGLAGDLTLYGNRKDVLLLRDNNGIQESQRIDLTDSSVINSKEFFLQQNDVLIVSPNQVQVNRTSAFLQNSGLFISIASLLLTATLIIIR